MKAVMLAGGEESLHNPLSKLSVKALLPVGNRPVLEYFLKLLKKHKIEEILVSAGKHSTADFRREFSNGRNLGIHLDYFEDDFPRGPAGCLVPLKQSIENETFVVLSPGYPMDIDLATLLERHRQHGNTATVAVTQHLDPKAKSYFLVDRNMQIVKHLDGNDELKNLSPEEREFVYQPMGIYVFEPDVFGYIAKESYMDIKGQLIPGLVVGHEQVEACLLSGEVNALRDVVDYVEANKAVFQNHNGLHSLGDEVEPGIFVGEGVELSPEANLKGPLVIGNRAKIGRGVKLYGPTVIGDGSVISENGIVRQSILWPETHLEPGAVLENSISCRGSRVRGNSMVSDSLVNGERLELGELTLARDYFKKLKLSSQHRGSGRTRVWFTAFVKRMMDLSAAIFGLAFFIIPMIFIAILIKIDSRGPVFFRQERCGKNRRRFKMIKFRSMIHNADQMIDTIRKDNQSDGPMFKIKVDPRLTRIGAFLRKTSLDEIPQLINVLKGEMSLVGPRPLAMREMKWSPRWRDIRLQVKPGITGLWQIHGRSNSQFHDWIKFDIEYVQTQSIWGDIKILVETLKTVFKGTGAY